MPEQPKPQEANYTMLGVLFTIIALVALLAIVLVKSKAQTNSELVNTHVGVNSASMTLDSETIVQQQGSGSPTDLTNLTPVATPSSPDAIITPGTTMAAPVHLKLSIVAPNGISNTILRPNAQLHVYFGHVSYGPYQPGSEGGTAKMDKAADTAVDPNSCTLNCGQTLWKLDQTGLDAGSGTGWTITPNPTDVTKADIDVVVALPYYALPGWWNAYWEIDPVDSAGALDASHAMFNPAGTMHNENDTRTFAAATWFKLGEMVAMDVSPTGLTYLKAGGAPMEPDSDSDYKTLTLKGKGNVDTNVSAYGDPAGWTCTSGQSFSVNQTHFGNRMAGAELGPIAFNATSSQILGGGVANKQFVKIIDPNILIKGTVEIITPIPYGDQDSVEAAGSIASNYNTFDTMIHVPAGIVGTCSSTMWTIASKAI